MRKDRQHLLNVEIPKSQAQYLQQVYKTKRPTQAVKVGLDRLCSLDHELLIAKDCDKQQALNISDEMKIRLMQTTKQPDWRLAALEVLIMYLDQHYKSEESN